MIRPTLEEFRGLARTHTVIPVWRELLADLTTPVAAFSRLVGDGTGFLLESVEHGEARWSRWSFVGRNPLATLTARGLDVEITGSVPDTVPRDQVILAALAALLAEWHAPSLPDLPPLHGGVLGYLGYDVVREVEHLPDVPKDDQGHALRIGQELGARVGVAGTDQQFDEARGERVEALGVARELPGRPMRRWQRVNSDTEAPDHVDHAEVGDVVPAEHQHAERLCRGLGL